MAPPSTDPAHGVMGNAAWLPWDAPRDWLLWFALAVIAAVVMHNVTRHARVRIGMGSGDPS